MKIKDLSGVLSDLTTFVILTKEEEDEELKKLYEELDYHDDFMNKFGCYQVKDLKCIEDENLLNKSIVEMYPTVDVEWCGSSEITDVSMAYMVVIVES